MIEEGKKIKKVTEVILNLICIARDLICVFLGLVPIYILYVQRSMLWLIAAVLSLCFLVRPAVMDIICEVYDILSTDSNVH